MLRCMIISAFVAICVSVSLADDLLPPDRPPHEVIDHYIDAMILEHGAQTAEVADDANLIRRTMLDLVGRPPTVSEARAYIESTKPMCVGTVIMDFPGEKLIARIIASNFSPSP